MMNGRCVRDGFVVHHLFERLNNGVGNLVEEFITGQRLHVLDRDPEACPFFADAHIVGHDDGDQTRVVVDLTHVFAVSGVHHHNDLPAFRRDDHRVSIAHRLLFAFPSDLTAIKRVLSLTLLTSLPCPASTTIMTFQHFAGTTTV